jgi:hypothetical protein
MHLIQCYVDENADEGKPWLRALSYYSIGTDERGDIAKWLKSYIFNPHPLTLGSRLSIINPELHN